MDSNFGGTSWRTPSTRTSTPRSEKPSIGVIRSIPLMMQADSAASSSSAGLNAAGLPARSVSSAISACLQRETLPWASIRTLSTWKFILRSRMGASRLTESCEPASAALPATAAAAAWRCSRRRVRAGQPAGDLLAAGDAAGVHHLAVDHDAGRGHDAVAHYGLDVLDLFEVKGQAL